MQGPGGRKEQRDRLYPQKLTEQGASSSRYSTSISVIVTSPDVEPNQKKWKFEGER